MAEQTRMEVFTNEGGHVIDRLKRLIHEGNVRRIIVKQDDQTVAEFPLTVGVIGAVLAPVLAAVGAIVALLAKCTIEVERVEDPPMALMEPASNGQQDDAPPM